MIFNLVKPESKFSCNLEKEEQNHVYLEKNCKSLWAKQSNEKDAQKNSRQRRLAIEQLESRELLSMTPLPTPIVTATLPSNNPGLYVPIQLPNGGIATVPRDIIQVQY
ncbi:MAG: hypothetical protein LBT05_10305 [Planctomycetaceae bacterium]|jgi:hypothetical protein|nr:hypothetical protein [Planctomycetaceae bacterium]